MVVASGYVVRRYIDFLIIIIITYPYSLLLCSFLYFCSTNNIPTFFSLCKRFLLYLMIEITLH